MLVVSLYAFADGFHQHTNFQGFTGLINTPNAEVLEDGKVEFAFSNQVDAFRIRNEKDKYTAEHYFINFGILPNLEVSGRLANIEDKGPSNRPFLDRDLSASVKYQIPFYHKYLPHIAIGIQDIAGTADRYKSKFIVLSKQYTFLEGSVGYGFGSNHLDGMFGGLEVRATEWLYLLGEYDTQDTRVGIRLNTPEKLFNLFDLSVSVNKNIDDTKEDVSFALTLKMDLGNPHDSIQKYPETCMSEEIQAPVPVSGTTTTTRSIQTVVSLESKLQHFQDALVSFGFENLDLGMKGDRMYVAYENHVLDHNELDAIGVILGYMVKYA